MNSDDEGPRTGGGGDDEVALPKSTINKLIAGALSARRLDFAELTLSVHRVAPCGLLRCEGGEGSHGRVLQG